MLILVCMMCMGLLVIVCLSGYDIIGIWVLVLLLIVRLFQGFLVGGEYGISVIYMSEVVFEGCKGFFVLFQYVMFIGGQLLVLLVVVILQQVLEDVEFCVWGWCIFFVLGVVLVVVVLWLCCQLDEILKYEICVLKEVGLLKGLWCNCKVFLMVFGFIVVGLLCFYIFIIYMQKYLVNIVGMYVNVVSGIMMVVLCVFMLVQLLFGVLFDKIGRCIFMLCFGVFVMFFIVLIFFVLQNVMLFYVVFVLVMCVLLIVSFYILISGILKVEMFLVQVCVLGVGLFYVVVNVLFGGFVEYVVLLLKFVGMESLFFWYVIVMVVLVFLVFLMLYCKGKGLCFQYCVICQIV